MARKSKEENTQAVVPDSNTPPIFVSREEACRLSKKPRNTSPS